MEDCVLTNVRIKAARPTDKPYKLTDSGGLYLHVTPAGGRIWRFRYEIAGREKLLTIGPYPSISLADARAARDNAKRLLRDGRDPSIERKLTVMTAADPNTSFEAIARAWYTLHTPTWRERHADDVIHSLERDVFPDLGQLQIRDITPPMVLKVLRAIEARPAIETARRVRQRISAVFVHAIASGIAEQDPGAVVQRALARPSKGRQPAVTDLGGLRTILRDAEAIPAHPATRMALRLIAITAVRPGELRGAAREEFAGLEGPEPTWIIPKERMKAKREHLVPLSTQAAELVRLATTLIGRNRLLFPSVRHPHRPMSENALGYLLNRAGYHGRHVPHGFRAAFSTIMNERFRSDRATIDLMLAHAAKDRTEAAYNRAEHIERRRELAQAWSDLLLDGLPAPESLLRLPRKSGNVLSTCDLLVTGTVRSPQLL